MAEQESFKVSIKGPGLTFDRPIDEAVANKIMSFVMTGTALDARANQESGGGTAVGAAAGMGTIQSGQTSKQFVTSKKPNTQYERVACLAYYLTHVDKLPNFKTLDITKANTAAAGPKIGNASQIVGDATKTYGYLSSAGKGSKQITALGEAVVEALPNREAVAAAIAEHRPRKKKARSTAKKKK